MPTLLDGRDAPSDSEDWRHECEARAILDLPGSPDDRRNWLDDLEARRGVKHADKLRETVLKMWRIRYSQHPRSSSTVERMVHTHEVAGSSPASATKDDDENA